jgi:hypothetical protein
MDIRNPPYVPRYVIPPRPQAGVIGITALSPRKTVNPSVDELLASHARVEEKIQRERRQEMSSREKTRRGAKVAAAAACAPPLHCSKLCTVCETLPSPRSFCSPLHAARDASAEVGVCPTPRSTSTKALFAASGLHGAPYFQESLITSTLADAHWFRLPRERSDENQVSEQATRRPCVALLARNRLAPVTRGQQEDQCTAAQLSCLLPSILPSPRR